jgi:hypothetical protein
VNATGHQLCLQLSFSREEGATASSVEVDVEHVIRDREALKWGPRRPRCAEAGGQVCRPAPRCLFEAFGAVATVCDRHIFWPSVIGAMLIQEQIKAKARA